MARVATLNSLPAPANFVVSSVSAGGTLAANTTYYYKIIAIYATTSSVRATDPIRSAPSQEISGTTDTTNKTINLSWTAVSGATGYMIWRTKASGDYRHKTTPEGNYFKCKALRTGAQVLIKEPIDITVIDEQNIPIESVTVSLTNKNDDLQFSVVTDINGKITQQEVMRMYVFSASSATHFVTADDKTDYNPFTLTVSKTGYETYTSKFTLSEKIDSIITLKKWKRLRLDTDGKEYIAINPAKGSRSKILKS